ncbi:MAG TPA: sugar phosphate isomerase/epimerase [Trebonia sp.]|nr:sugar phosphate isomerase/epimerase [Trebonia sp.]
MTINPPALQLYTLREELASGRPEVLRAVRSFGYGAVEPYDVKTDPEQQRADLDAAGLAVTSVHARALGEEAGVFFSGARTVGADTVIVPWTDPERWADKDSIETLARDINESAAKAADLGLRLGYHNHWFELEANIGGTTGLEVLADALDPAVILEVDTYWAAVGGQDVPALLRRLGDRVRYLHVKDGPITHKDDMVAVGQGRMPIADILAAAPAAEWHVVELDRCATDMTTAVRESLAWLVEQGLAEPVGERA